MPAGKNAEQKEMEIPTEKMQENHVAAFVNAVKEKNRNLIACTLDDAFRSTATVQLAMASYYSESEVKWDPKKLSVIDNKKAASLMARPYRGSYKRPKV
jgi:uncharacterized protein involved in exopolysaccharide biosynthesis